MDPFDPKNRKALRDEADRDTKLALERQKLEEERKKALHKSTLDAQIRRLEDSIRRAEPRLNQVKSELAQIEREDVEAAKSGKDTDAEKIAEEHHQMDLDRQVRAEELKLRSLETKESMLGRDIEKHERDVAAKVAKEQSGTEAENAKISKELGDAKRDASLGKAERQRLRSEVDRLKRELGIKENALKQIEQRIAADESKEKELGTKAKTIAPAKGKDAAESARIEREKRELEKLTSEKADEAKKVQTLKSELEALKAKIRAMSVRHQSFGAGSGTHKKIAKERDLRTQEQELATLKQDLANLERERQSLR